MNDYTLMKLAFVAQGVACLLVLAACVVAFCQRDSANLPVRRNIGPWSSTGGQQGITVIGSNQDFTLSPTKSFPREGILQFDPDKIKPASGIVFGKATSIPRGGKIIEGGIDEEQKKP